MAIKISKINSIILLKIEFYIESIVILIIYHNIIMKNNHLPLPKDTTELWKAYNQLHNNNILLNCVIISNSRIYNLDYLINYDIINDIINDNLSNSKNFQQNNLILNKNENIWMKKGKNNYNEKTELLIKQKNIDINIFKKLDKLFIVSLIIDNKNRYMDITFNIENEELMLLNEINNDLLFNRDKKFLESYDFSVIDNLSITERTVIIVADYVTIQYNDIKNRIQNALENFCDDIYDTIFSYIFLTPKIRNNILVVSKRFNKLVMKFNIQFTCDVRLKCELHKTCKNKIYIIKNSMMKHQPICSECVIESDINYRIVRCDICKCLFDDTFAVGFNQRTRKFGQKCNLCYYDNVKLIYGKGRLGRIGAKLIYEKSGITD